MPISDSTTVDLYRTIREHLPSLIPGLAPSDISTMSLGLSHSLSRHKLKFSPDKVDTMVVQAISLLDDLDKELNTYAMRVKEWYGWHFPEMAKIINDNVAYARVILHMGLRTNASKADLAEVLPEEIEAAVKAAAEVSMGTEIASEDLENIQALAQQVVDFSEYRSQLSNYLTARMAAIAPNLTALVGELVGARLIAHAGSLMNLAKNPASTIQILGAEKALFRALKTKHATPKYGLIFHASLVGQASGKNKGKIARMLAGKAAISLRVDALSEWGIEAEDVDEPTDEVKAEFGMEARIKLERRLAKLEGKPIRSKGTAIAPNGVSGQPQKWEIKEARKYNKDADGLAGDEPAAAQPTAKTSEKVQEIEPKDVEMAEVDEEDDDDDEDKDEDEDEDEDMEDGNEELAVAAVSTSKAKLPSLVIPTTNGKSNGNISDTITTPSVDSPDSPDSPTQQELNWQSSILGNTKDAKKARKKERHERKLALSAGRSEEKKERNEKLARRLARKEKRIAKDEQVQRRLDRENEKYIPLAKAAGLSVTRYKRKLERGEITIGEDGKPAVVSKKDIKRERKAVEKAIRKAEKNAAKKEADADAEVGTKRKRVNNNNNDGDGDGDGERSERKKKKKSKAE